MADKLTLELMNEACMEEIIKLTLADLNRMPFEDLFGLLKGRKSILKANRLTHPRKLKKIINEKIAKLTPEDLRGMPLNNLLNLVRYLGERKAALIIGIFNERIAKLTSDDLRRMSLDDLLVLSKIPDRIINANRSSLIGQLKEIIKGKIDNLTEEDVRRMSIISRDNLIKEMEAVEKREQKLR